MSKALVQSLALIVLTAVAAVLTGWLHPLTPAYAPPSDAEHSPLSITWTEVEALEGAVLWVDARSETEYAERHAPGAILLNEDQWGAGFEELILNWSPDRTVVVYCNAASCHASEAVAMRLRRELGADNIYFLEGGWATWLAHESD